MGLIGAEIASMASLLTQLFLKFLQFTAVNLNHVVEASKSLLGAPRLRIFLAFNL